MKTLLGSKAPQLQIDMDKSLETPKVSLTRDLSILILN